MRMQSVTTLVSFFLATEAFAQTPAPAAAAPAKSDVTKVEFPKAYRSWTHVKSMVIFGKEHPLFGAFGGIHHVYANPSALKALQGDRKFPPGAALAFDLLDIEEGGGAHKEGKRKFVALVVRDPKKYPASTEGWGWQAWEGGDPKKPVLSTLAAQQACSTCHQEVGAKGFIFTEWRD